MSHSMASCLNTADADRGPALECLGPSPCLGGQQSRGAAASPEPTHTAVTADRGATSRTCAVTLSGTLTRQGTRENKPCSRRKTARRNEMCNAWPGPPPRQPPKRNRPQDGVSQLECCDDPCRSNGFASPLGQQRRRVPVQTGPPVPRRPLQPSSVTCTQKAAGKEWHPEQSPMQTPSAPLREALGRCVFPSLCRQAKADDSSEVVAAVGHRAIHPAHTGA